MLLLFIHSFFKGLCCSQAVMCCNRYLFKSVGWHNALWKLNLTTKWRISLIKLFLWNNSPVVCVFDLNACRGDEWGENHGGEEQKRCTCQSSMYLLTWAPYPKRWVRSSQTMSPGSSTAISLILGGAHKNWVNFRNKVIIRDSHTSGNSWMSRLRYLNRKCHVEYYSKELFR